MAAREAGEVRRGKAIPPPSFFFSLRLYTDAVTVCQCFSSYSVKVSVWIANCYIQHQTSTHSRHHYRHYACNIKLYESLTQCLGLFSLCCTEIINAIASLEGNHANRIFLRKCCATKHRDDVSCYKIDRIEGTFNSAFITNFVSVCIYI